MFPVLRLVLLPMKSRGAGPRAVDPPAEPSASTAEREGPRTDSEQRQAAAMTDYAKWDRFQDSDEEEGDGQQAQPATLEGKRQLLVYNRTPSTARKVVKI